MDDHENCHVELLEKPLDRIALSTAEAAILTVSGMGCPRCAMRVRNGLLSLDGVLVADVHLERGVAVVAFDPKRARLDYLLTAVAAAGNDGRHNYQARSLGTMRASDAFTIAV